MSIQLKQFESIADEKTLIKSTHVLIIVPDITASNKLAKGAGTIPFLDVLETKLKRSRSKLNDLAKAPVTSDLPDGGVASWVVLTDKLATFERHTLLRKAIKPLLDEKPQSVTIAVYGNEQQRQQSAVDALYVVMVNAAELPNSKGAQGKQKSRLIKTVALHGCKSADNFADIQALVSGNTLTRSLTMLPPNELSPQIYREKVVALAKEHGWKHQEYDMKKLKKMGAGAFVAVGQGSDPQDAAIVHLSYSPKGAKKHVALVGKGICFDTGGHNLKSAKYMNGMHEDMNGSAVALGILVAATQANLPVKIDCWLAIAQNHIGPLAYKQNDVVTSLNGTTIEIVHTDAEGRMVLADTLTLASREKPQLMLDFATLTGSMVGALGNRYSGILSNRPELLCKAIGIGIKTGERVSAFPFDEDYEEDLESSIADIKQCTLDSEADHVLAARFLYKFIEHKDDIAWLHMDLSSYNRKGGLGAVVSDVNGFGVSLSFSLIKNYLEKQ